LAQYFVEELEGAVLAINVKDVDFLRMNRRSNTINPKTLKEWQILDKKPHGIENYIVYYPANTDVNAYRDVDIEYFKPVTLSVHPLCQCK